MNPIIEFFQGLASHVPDLLQPFIIVAAGAIPFIEGEISSIIGVWARMSPVLAGIAGAIGNFICVAVIVILGSSAISGTLTGRLVSACSSMLLPAGGYFLIVDSFAMSLIMAGAVCGLLFVVSSVMEQRGWPSAIGEQST